MEPSGPVQVCNGIALPLPYGYDNENANTFMFSGNKVFGS